MISSPSARAGERHRPGTGRDWTDDEIGVLRIWSAAARHVPYALLAIAMQRSPNALRVKLCRIRKADREAEAKR